MASNKKYVENLIGDWETGQYEPVRQAEQSKYNTNWNRLANEFEYLK